MSLRGSPVIRLAFVGDAYASDQWLVTQSSCRIDRRLLRPVLDAVDRLVAGELQDVVIDGVVFAPSLRARLNVDVRHLVDELLFDGR